MLRYQHVHTLGTTSTSAQWRRGLHPTTTPWCVLRYSMCHVRSTMFLNSNSFHKFLKSHLLSRCACFQNVWHPLSIHTHDLLCSSPHGDIRIVIWPIIILKYSYVHFSNTIQSYPYMLLFPQFKATLCKIFGLQDSLDRDWRPITSLTSSCVPSCRYQRSIAFAQNCRKKLIA